MLGIEEGEKINLQFHEGFFFCPNDQMNKESSLPKILLPETIIEILERKDPSLFSQLFHGYNYIFPSTSLPWDNYSQFLQEIAVIYLLAASSYIIEENPSYKKISQLYQEPHKTTILKKFTVYLQLFLARHGYKHNLMEFYSTARDEIGSSDEYLKFIETVPSSYNLVGHLIGGVLEEEIRNDQSLEIFQKEIKKHEQRFAALCGSVVRSPGILFGFEADDDVRDQLQKKAQGLGHPDFIFVTKEFIFPVDCKINLTFAKERQISAQNLREVLGKIPDTYQTIFNNITVEGKLIESVAEQALDKIVEKKTETPMQSLLKEGIIEKQSIGIIAKLWGLKKTVTIATLEQLGVKGNLARIVKVFNEMLQNENK